MKIKRALIVLANVLAALVLLEFGAWVLALANGGNPYSVKELQLEKTLSALPPSDRELLDFAQANAVAVNDERRLHPFFGFTYSPAKKGMNNAGFGDTLDFPYRKAPGEFVVGVFGGSFAQHLGGVEPRRSLAEGFKRILSACSVDRVVVLNFAQGSYRQPQSLFTYLYYANGLDAVIFVDGFNEVMTLPRETQERKDSWPLAFPKERLWTSLARREISQAEIRWRYEVSQIREEQWSHVAWRQRPPFSKSLFAHRIWLTLNNNLEDRARALIENGRTSSPDHAAQWSSESGGDDYLDRYELWIRSAWLTAHDEGQLFYHMVQPNQYVEGSKKFNAEDRQIAIDPNRGTGRKVREFYPKWIGLSESLRARGVPSYDMTRVLKDNAETLYLDSCCHLNQRGMVVFGEKILEVVAASRQFEELRASCNEVP